MKIILFIAAISAVANSYIITHNVCDKRESSPSSCIQDSSYPGVAYGNIANDFQGQDIYSSFHDYAATTLSPTDTVISFTTRGLQVIDCADIGSFLTSTHVYSRRTPTKNSWFPPIDEIPDEQTTTTDAHTTSAYLSVSSNTPTTTSSFTEVTNDQADTTTRGSILGSNTNRPASINDKVTNNSSKPQSSNGDAKLDYNTLLNAVIDAMHLTDGDSIPSTRRAYLPNVADHFAIHDSNCSSRQCQAVLYHVQKMPANDQCVFCSRTTYDYDVNKLGKKCCLITGTEHQSHQYSGDGGYSIFLHSVSFGDLLQGNSQTFPYKSDYFTGNIASLSYIADKHSTCVSSTGPCSGTSYSVTSFGKIVKTDPNDSEYLPESICCYDQPPAVKSLGLVYLDNNAMMHQEEISNYMSSQPNILPVIKHSGLVYVYSVTQKYVSIPAPTSTAPDFIIVENSLYTSPIMPCLPAEITYVGVPTPPYSVNKDCYSTYVEGVIVPSKDCVSGCFFPGTVNEADTVVIDGHLEVDLDINLCQSYNKDDIIFAATSVALSTSAHYIPNDFNEYPQTAQESKNLHLALLQISSLKSQSFMASFTNHVKYVVRDMISDFFSCKRNAFLMTSTGSVDGMNYDHCIYPDN